MTRRELFARRFFAKVRVNPNGCWEWTAFRTVDGYGMVGDGNGKVTGAHRASYTFFNGPIPKGLHIDHLCKNPSCVRPAHLEMVTPAENTWRAFGSDAERCPRGHVRAEVGTTKQRACRECGREASRRWKERVGYVSQWKAWREAQQAI